MLNSFHIPIGNTFVSLGGRVILNVLLKQTDEALQDLLNGPDHPFLDEIGMTREEHDGLVRLAIDMKAEGWW